MKVIWRNEAKRELREIVAFIRKENPTAARRVYERIKAGARQLEHLPDKYREGVVPGTREQVVRGLPYLIVYRVDPAMVHVLAVFHAAQNIPRGG